MRKQLLLLNIILTLLLYGCSVNKTTNTYPNYFMSVIQEIEELHENNDTWYVIHSLREDSIGNGSYNDKVFTCYIDGEYYSFNLANELTESEEWNWVSEGVFHRDGEDKAYALFTDFNLVPSGEKAQVRNPQLILIEFSINNPENYQVMPYEVEPYGAFVWFDDAYRINDRIYFNASTAQYNLGVINLNTKEFHYCVDEYSYAQEYAEKYIENNFSDKSYRVYFFRGVFESDDVTVYSASISEGNDIPPVGLIFMAYENDKPIAYMSVDLTVDDIIDGIKIEIMKNSI